MRKNRAVVFLSAVLTILCLAGFAAPSWSVSGVAVDPSQTLYGARQLGMGGLSVNYSDDANGVLLNPAGLAGISFPQMSASSRKIMLEETSYSLIDWAMPTDYGTFGIGYVGMAVGNSFATVRDPASGRIIENASVEAGNFTNNVVAFSYSRGLNFPLKTAIGANIKFLSQSLSGGNSNDKGSNINLNLGLTCQATHWLSLGAVMQNLLGGSVKWANSEDTLGGYLKLGGKVSLLGSSHEALLANSSQKLSAGLDLDLPRNVLSSSNAMLYHLGFEYLPVSFLALRAGINQEAAGNGMTLGVGFINSGFRFDYAYAQRPGLPGDNPSYFSISYIGDRIENTSFKLLRKAPYLKILSPSDRHITDLEMVTLSGEAWSQRILERTRTWTVIGVCTTRDAYEVVENEPIGRAFVNGKAINNPLSFEARELLYHGRNTFKLAGYTSSEIINFDRVIQAVLGSVEIHVLRVDPFVDTPLYNWAAEPIYLCVTLGLITGYPDKTFRPEKGITRAELVTLLVRSLGMHDSELEKRHGRRASFKDVKTGHWANKYIGFGNTNNLVTGYPGGKFLPNKVLTRAEAITIMARYAKLSEEAKGVAPPFPDLKENFWANKYIAPAKQAGLLKYLSGKDFSPATHFTRAEACEVLYQCPLIKRRVNEFWEIGTISANQAEPHSSLEAVPSVPKIVYVSAEVNFLTEEAR